jgi:hypothetical protein
VADAVATAVINKRAGGTGPISGRKAFQRPMKERVELPPSRCLSLQGCHRSVRTTHHSSGVERGRIRHRTTERNSGSRADLGADQEVFSASSFS